MTRIKSSYLGFWVLVLILALRIIFLAGLYFLAQRFQFSRGDSFGQLFLTPYNIGFLVVLLAEAIVYWFLRYRIHRVQWVWLHVWPLFFAVAVVPLVYVLSFMALSHYYSKDEMFAWTVEFTSIRHYIFWILVPLAHLFFIATIVRGFVPVNEKKDEAPGLLDEFID